MICELDEQIPKHLPVIGAQESEESVVVAIRDLRKLRDNASAYNCQRKQLDAIVFRVDLAPDPSFRLKFVDDLGDRSTGHRQGFGQLSRCCLPPIVKVTQQHPLGNGCLLFLQ